MRVLEHVTAGVRGSVLRLAVGGEPVVVRLPLAGEHNARNAAAALAVVLALGLSPRQAAAAMEKVELPAHRSRMLELGGLTVLDDCYNANPASMSAALETVSRVGRVGAIVRRAGGHAGAGARGAGAAPAGRRASWPGWATRAWWRWARWRWRSPRGRRPAACPPIGC